MKLLAALALPAMLACAQEPKTPDYKTHSDLVFLPTLVHKPNGDVIFGLKPEQFVVEDNGVRQTVNIEEDPDTAGISLAVVVQCGLSAPAEFAKLKGLGAMIDAITGEAPHEVAVLSYGQRPYLLGDFTSDPDALSRALAKLAPCGDYHAATIDAASYAVKLLQRRENRYRRAILLVSEMRDHGSRAKLHEVAAELGIGNTVIYCVTFAPTRNEFVSAWRNPDPPPPPKPFSTGPNPPPPPPPKPEPVETGDYTDHAPPLSLPPQLMLIVNALRKNSASELAALSGGESMSFTDQRSFDRSLHRIANQIHNYYLLSFKPGTTAAPSLHTLRVRVPDHPDAVVETRRNYWSGVLE